MQNYSIAERSYMSFLQYYNSALTLWMLGNFLKIDYIVVCFLKPLNSDHYFFGNDGLSSKLVGSQASRRVTRRLAWIQPVCISINAVPALKGLMIIHFFVSKLHLNCERSLTSISSCSISGAGFTFHVPCSSTLMHASTQEMHHSSR